MHFLLGFVDLDVVNSVEEPHAVERDEASFLLFVGLNVVGLDFARLAEGCVIAWQNWTGGQMLLMELSITPVLLDINQAECLIIWIVRDGVHDLCRQDRKVEIQFLLIFHFSRKLGLLLLFFQLLDRSERFFPIRVIKHTFAWPLLLRFLNLFAVFVWLGHLFGHVSYFVRIGKDHVVSVNELIIGFLGWK